MDIAEKRFRAVEKTGISVPLLWLMACMDGHGQPQEARKVFERRQPGSIRELGSTWKRWVPEAYKTSDGTKAKFGVVDAIGVGRTARAARAASDAHCRRGWSVGSSEEHRRKASLTLSRVSLCFCRSLIWCVSPSRSRHSLPSCEKG